MFAALRAADELAERGVFVRVIDAYSIEPIDRATIRWALRDTRRLVVVEDHVAAAWLGDAVFEAATGSWFGRSKKLAVPDYPGCASPQEQRRFAGSSSEAIVAAIQELLSEEGVRPEDRHGDDSR